MKSRVSATRSGRMVIPVIPKWSLRNGVSVLLGLTCVVVVLSDILVDSLEGMMKTLPLTPQFLGTIVLTAFVNAADPSGAVRLARKNRIDLVYQLVSGAATPVALLVGPLFVVVGWLIGKPMTLQFSMLQVFSVAVATLILKGWSFGGKNPQAGPGYRMICSMADGDLVTWRRLTCSVSITSRNASSAWNSVWTPRPLEAPALARRPRLAAGARGCRSRSCPANPQAWEGLGPLNWMDWRQQPLTTSWAIKNGMGSHWSTYGAARRAVAVLRALALLLLLTSGGLAQEREIRACWITHVDSQVMDSRENLEEAMAFLESHGFNTVYVVVWARGLTLYPSERMGAETGQTQDPRFSGRDPLAEAVDSAHRHGLAVVAWFEYGFADSYGGATPRLTQVHPEWLCLDPSGAPVVKNGFRWLNGLDPQVQEFLLGLMDEVRVNYAVDGLQGDDRWPAMPSTGGYNPSLLADYGRPAPAPLDADWLEWRARGLTRHLREARRRFSDRWLISAPSIQGWAYREYLQDWISWLQDDLVDHVHPQAYRRNLADYQSCLQPLLTLLTPQQRRRVAPAILIQSGAYRITPELLLAKIRWNRACGFGGEALFFYEGLRAHGDELGRALSAGPYRRPAPSQAP